ncbi:LytR C-terminal domain-containing protein [Actinomycetota bacterium]
MAGNDREQQTPNPWRKGRMRQVAVFVTLPALIFGTATVSAAYSAGLLAPREAASCQPTLVRAPARSSFTVKVLNATGVDGVATTTGRELKHRGYRVTEATNAPESLLVREPGLIYHGPDGLDAALLVASQIPGATLSNDGRAGKSVDLALGLAYKDLVPVPPRPAPRAKTIKVNVYNTTYHEGLAKRVLNDLTAREFKPGKTGNDPKRTWQLGVGVIRYGPEGLRQAKVLRQHLPGVTLEQDDRKDTSLDFVIGMKYKSLGPIAAVPVPPPVSQATAPTVARPCTPEG